MGFLTGWFGYGLGKAAGKAIFGGGTEPRRSDVPIRSMTEAEIRADEQRFAEDARRLDEEDRKKPG